MGSCVHTANLLDSGYLKPIILQAAVCKGRSHTPRQCAALIARAPSRGPQAQMGNPTHPGGWTSRLQWRSEVHLEVQDEQQCRVVPRTAAVYNSCKTSSSSKILVNLNLFYNGPRFDRAIFRRIYYRNLNLVDLSSVQLQMHRI